MKSDIFPTLVLKSCLDECGAAASEYAITVAAVAVVIAATVSEYNLNGIFPAVIAKIAALLS